MRGDIPAKLVIDVLKEARVKFGPFTPDNKDQITRYVRRRVEQVMHQQPEGTDNKAAAAGERE